MVQNKQLTLLGVGKSQRIENDLYETPEFFVNELLKHKNFDKNILEPACGNGKISSTLITAGYNVYSADIIKRNYPCNIKNFITDDFEYKKYDIITNPPYSLMSEFINKASFVAKNKFAFVGRIQLLEGINRYNNFYKNGINDFRLKKVICSVKRLNFISNKEFNHTSAMMSAWFVFERQYTGKPVIEFCNI